jgi:hypothetical protein
MLKKACGRVALSAALAMFPGLCAAAGQDVRAQAYDAGNDNLWYASPNVAVISRLPFDARYVIHLAGANDFTHRVEILRDMRRLSYGGSALVIEEEATALVAGRDIALFAPATALPPNVPLGTYALQGLDKGRLTFNQWGGTLGVRLIHHDSTTAPADLPVLRFKTEQFLRVCIDGVVANAAPAGTPDPLVAISVDGKLILRSAPGAPPEPALWRRGCVDTVGRKVDVTLVAIARPDTDLPPPQGLHRVSGKVFFAPLAEVRAETDLANTPFPHRPPTGRSFTATWSSTLRQSVIASDLPEPERYLLTMDDDFDGVPANLEVSSTGGTPDAQLHEGGGLALETANLRLDGLPALGSFTLLGYGEGDFRPVRFAVEGSPRNANSYMPTSIVARFDRPQFVRLCVDGSRRTDTADPAEPTAVRGPHLVPFRNGQPLGPSGRVAAMDAGCTDFVACDIDAGMLGDKLVPGLRRIDATLYHRPLPAPSAACR